MTTLSLRGLLVLALLATAARGQEPLKVLATLPTYGSLAQTIGGDLVEVITVCRPGQDVHGVSPTPSMMARARGADLVLCTGLDAETWLEPLLRASGNGELLPGSAGYVALSDGIPLKEVPAVLSRAAGDVHAWGNTHVWTDPYHVRGMAARVRDVLVDTLPTHADALSARHAAFHERMTRALIGWLTEFKTLRGEGVVTYHTSWIYLAERFGLERVGTVEPKPRVAPTAGHLEALVETMIERGTRVIVREPWQFPDAAQFVAQRTGATVLVLSTHPGYPEGTEDVVDHFEHNLSALRAALKGEATAADDEAGDDDG
jgi:zinc/manganese transport system substrate-binding protein